jgi:NAD(P)-dependent dehydrogenase (short-subunit alcohol dehydrogenase family)
MKKTILITGASSGFGKLAAKKFQAEGWNVVATMRTPEKETELNQLENITITKLDVTDKDSINSAVNATIERFGKIDALVNNAGYGALGVMEAATEEQIRKEFDVNFFGLIDVTRAVLPFMRKEKSGVIVNISSVGGRITFPFFSLYHASKFAVEGLTESMQYELYQLGIKVKLVEPGAYNTDFGTRSLTIFDAANCPEYHKGFKQFTDAMQQMMSISGDPQEVADTIFEAVTDDSERLRYLIGKDAEQMIQARTAMDDIDFKKMMLAQTGLDK